ncbi:MAG: FAD-dependent oxidoreductase [Bdellovibrionales bacterium]|nr:FAD-dependent oxidoreductase [Bdellovibrionales bacterium]
MSRVTVVGAGFAGLTAAYELIKAGFEVTVHEHGERAGGLLGTHRTAFGLVETAANALLCSREIEELFADVGVAFAERRPERRKRYIFWNKPRRWPLGLAASVRTLIQGCRLSLGNKDLVPMEGESIAEWARRFAGPDFEQRLLSPALQGIYAGDPENMSALLILGKIFADRPAKGRWKGSVAPEGGMGALVKALEAWLEERGVKIHYGSQFAFSEPLSEPVVLATSAWSAATLLKATHPHEARLLETCESLPLVTTTCFFEPQHSDLKGFGCLFPRSQQFRALGVLFNASVFEKRSSVRSETWILGGASQRNSVDLSDEQILEAIQADRSRLNKGTAVAAPLDYKITRWPRAIPHYTLAWERTLLALNPKPPLFLHGNYLGEIGLSRIYSRSRRLAQQIKEMYG